MKKQLSKTRKIGLTVAALAVIALLFIYFLALAPNFGVKRYVYVYVDNRHSYKNLCEQIQDSAHCRNMATFRFLASAFRYPGKMKAGRYIVRKGMSNLTLLRNLRNGRGCQPDKQGKRNCRNSNEHLYPLQSSVFRT